MLSLLGFLASGTVLRAVVIPVIIFFLKTLFLFVVYVALPFVLFTFGVNMMGFIVNWSLGFISSNFENTFTVTISGIGGYLYNQMYLGQCISIIFTAIAVRYTVDFVRGSIR